MSYPVVRICDELTDQAWAEADVNEFGEFEERYMLLAFKQHYSTFLFHLIGVYCYEYKLFSIYPKDYKEALELENQLKYGFAWGGQECLIYAMAIALYKDLKDGKAVDFADSILSYRYHSYLESENYKNCVRPKMIAQLEDIGEFIRLIS